MSTQDTENQAGGHEDTTVGGEENKAETTVAGAEGASAATDANSASAELHLRLRNLAADFKATGLDIVGAAKAIVDEI